MLLFCCCFSLRICCIIYGSAVAVLIPVAVAVANSASLSDDANRSVSEGGLETDVPWGSVISECNEEL